MPFRSTVPLRLGLPLTRRTVRGFLWCLSAALVLAGGLALVLAATLPLAVQGSWVPDEGRSTRTSTSAPAAVPSRQSLEALAARDLRRPLYDAAVSAPAPVPAFVPPPLTVRLTGTIVEADRSLAVLVESDGRTQLRAIGEKVGEAVILQIGEGTVQLRYYGQVVTLTLARETKG